MGDAKVQQSPRINSKKGGIVPINLFDLKKLIKGLILFVGYRLVDEYKAFTISRYGSIKLSNEILNNSIEFQNYISNYNHNVLYLV
jgi:hypothetical protein